MMLSAVVLACTMYMYVRVHEYEVDCKVIRMAPHNKYHDVSAQTPQYVRVLHTSESRSYRGGRCRQTRTRRRRRRRRTRRARSRTRRWRSCRRRPPTPTRSSSTTATATASSASTRWCVRACAHYFFFTAVAFDIVLYLKLAFFSVQNIALR